MSGDMSAVVAFNDAINARDLDALADLMSDGHRFVDSGGSVIVGKQDSVDAWRDFFNAFPDYHNVFDEIIQDGDRVVVRGHSVSSISELDGPALWSAAIGSGLITEWRVYEDTAESRSALGFG